MPNWTEYWNNAMGYNRRWGGPIGPIPTANQIYVKEGLVYPPLSFGIMSVRMIPNDWVMDSCAFAKKEGKDCPRISDPSIDCSSCPIRPENNFKRAKKGTAHKVVPFLLNYKS